MKKSEGREDLEFEIAFYEGILKEDPDFVPALIPLADDYTKVGRHEEGLALDERLSRLRPDDPLVHYNLACSCALTGRIERALASLRRAIDLGYDDLEWMEKDEDLDAVRATGGYSDILAALRSRKGAT